MQIFGWKRPRLSTETIFGFEIRLKTAKFLIITFAFCSTYSLFNASTLNIFNTATICICTDFSLYARSNYSIWNINVEEYTAVYNCTYELWIPNGLHLVISGWCRMIKDLIVLWLLQFCSYTHRYIYYNIYSH
jgi:hypothetical protein